MTRHWSAIAWIACLAILFNAFVPLLASARGADASTAPMEMEVCTALGMEMMSFAPPASEDGKPAKTMGHCECCMSHATAHGLPPPVSALAVLPAVHAVYPPLYYLAPHPLFSWSLAQPRAPPVRG